MTELNLSETHPQQHYTRLFFYYYVNSFSWIIQITLTKKLNIKIVSYLKKFLPLYFILTGWYETDWQTPRGKINKN